MSKLLSEVIVMIVLCICSAVIILTKWDESMVDDASGEDDEDEEVK